MEFQKFLNLFFSLIRFNVFAFEIFRSVLERYIWVTQCQKNIDKVIKTILFSVRHVYTLYTPIIPYLNLYIIIIYNYMILFSDLRVKTQGVQEPWTLDNLREILIHSFRLCVILWKPPTINMAAPQESAQGVNKALSLDVYYFFIRDTI